MVFENGPRLRVRLTISLQQDEPRQLTVHGQKAIT